MIDHVEKMSEAFDRGRIFRLDNLGGIDACPYIDQPSLAVQWRLGWRHGDRSLRRHRSKADGHR